jgi:hypothetical protein
MSGRCCFIDTTVLAEALLKAQDKRRRARAKINGYSSSLLPVYAIKELKLGPLRHYIWLHNKLVDTRSFSRTIRAIHNAFHKPYLKGTVEEALEVGAESLVGSHLAAANTRQKTQVAMADSLRLSLRRRIEKAWSDRRKIATQVVDELSCFREVAHSYNEETKYIDQKDGGCESARECCLSADLRKRRGDLHKLIAAIKDSERAEDKRRKKSLYHLLQRPEGPFRDTQCRSLGDAYWALRCPVGCAILTSNDKDHTVLASALRKQVEKY